MLYISLKTKSYKEKRQTQHITKEIRDYFGRANVDATDYLAHRSIRINDDDAMGHINFWMSNLPSLYVYRTNDDNYIKIPYEVLETIYL